MNNRGRKGGTSLAFHLMCLAVLFLLAPSADTLAQTGRVDGTVVNRETGEPVSGARVIIENTRWFALTDRDGRYSILDVPVGVYDLRIEAVGFELTVQLNHRLEPDDRRLIATHPTSIDFALRPLSMGTEGRTASTPPATALLPGIGLGFSLGMTGLGGNAHLSVRNAVSADASVRYGTAFGLFLHVGAQYGSHPMDSVASSLGLFALYVEPRFVLLHASSRWAPFVGGRFALTREQAEDIRASFTASGYSVGGETGVIYRLSPQLAIEGGLGVGVLTVGDYVFQGDLNSYTCVDGLEDGTSLAESVIRCGTLSGGALLTCYPPFHDVRNASGVCDLPEIPRDGSGRSGWWYRVRLGLQLSLGRL